MAPDNISKCTNLSWGTSICAIHLGFTPHVTDEGAEAQWGRALGEATKAKGSGQTVSEAADGALTNGLSVTGSRLMARGKPVGLPVSSGDKL